jgi:flagellar transcriptional activator FlhC
MASNRELNTELGRYQTAQQLFSVGARVPIVRELTQLSPWLLRKFYVDTTGEKPSRGPIPSSVEWYLTGINHLQSSLFLQYYQSVQVHEGEVNASYLLLAYQMWRSSWALTQLKSTLSFDRAWWLIKLIRSDLIKGQACRVCRGIYIVGLKRLGTYRCPRCFKSALSYGPRKKQFDYLPPREKSSNSVSSMAYISSSESSSVS